MKKKFNHITSHTYRSIYAILCIGIVLLAPLSGFSSTEVDVGVVSLTAPDVVMEGDEIEIFGYVRNYALDPYSGDIEMHLKVEDYLPNNINSLEQGDISFTLENVFIDEGDSISFSIDIAISNDVFSINTTDIIIIWPVVDEDIDDQNDAAYKSLFINPADEDTGGSSDEDGGGSSEEDEGGSSEEDEGSSDEEGNNGSSEEGSGNSSEDEESEMEIEESTIPQSLESLSAYNGLGIQNLNQLEQILHSVNPDDLKSYKLLIFDYQIGLKAFLDADQFNILNSLNLSAGIYKVILADSASYQSYQLNLLVY